MMNQRCGVVMILIALLFSACRSQVPTLTQVLSPAPTPKATKPTTTVIPPTLIFTPTLEQPTQEIFTDQEVPWYIRGIQFLESGIHAESYYRPPVRPKSVRISPTGQVLILGDDTTIYLLGENGEMTVYAELDSITELVTQFGFDPQGRMWASTNGNGYYQITEKGIPLSVGGKRANREFVFDSAGNIYAVDFPGTSVQKITPDGMGPWTIAKGFGESNAIALTKNDEIIIIEVLSGELLLINPDGTWEEILGGVGRDANIAISPDGAIYLTDWSGIYEVDLTRRTMTRVEWYQPYANTANRAVFDSQGYMITYHVNHPIFRLDLESESLEELFHPYGNTLAMAVSPEGRVFAAYGNGIPGGQTRLFEVVEGEGLVEIGSVPYREPRSMSFTSEGKGLLAVRGPASEQDPKDIYKFYSGATYQFDPVRGELETIPLLCCTYYESIDQNPVTGEYWWLYPNDLGVLDTAGKERRVPFPENGIQLGDLEFSDDGTLYALFQLRSTSPGSGGWRLYRLLDGAKWELLYASTANNSPFNANDFALCANDSLYLMGFTNGSLKFIPGWKGPMGFLGRLEDGKIVPLAYPTGNDIFAVDCDPDTNSIYYTNTEGIGKIVIEAGN